MAVKLLDQMLYGSVSKAVKLLVPKHSGLATKESPVP